MIALGALCIVASGCASAEPAGVFERPATRQPARPPERVDTFPIISVHEVQIDGAHKGYLEVRVDPESSLRDPLQMDHVYDLQFTDVGFVTARGRIYRFSGEAVEDLGVRERLDGIRALLGGREGARVTLAPMSPPRTLDDEEDGGRS